MRFGQIITIGAVFLLLFSTGCATPYTRESSNWLMNGGYTDSPSAVEGMQLVSFRGSSSTPATVVGIYLLYRCAEVTTGKGFSFFYIEHSDERSLQGITRTIDVNHPYRGVWNWQPEEYYWSKSQRSVLIKFSNIGNPHRPAVYDAREMLRCLGPDVEHVAWEDNPWSRCQFAKSHREEIP